MKKDNTTFRQKMALRQNLLREIDNPVVLETHGGFGHIYDHCYRGVFDGVVFEKDAKKAEFLARQRKTWAVYECDCVDALQVGVGSHLAINVVDVDPYGAPWPVIDALLSGYSNKLPDRWGLAVNDGLRQRVGVNGGWDIACLSEAVSNWGATAMHRNYLDVCRWMLEKKVATVGFTVAKWAGYYCGRLQAMTHYAALLKKNQ
jgi:hypothetical protein